MNKRIDEITEEYEQRLAQQKGQFLKAEKILKEELQEYRQKEIKLLEENETLKSTVHLQGKELQAK
jgi:hypothetical protein